MKLEQYTDKRLRDELKRRADIRNADKYTKFTGEVIGIKNKRWTYKSGDHKFLPYQFWEFVVKTDFFEDIGVKSISVSVDHIKLPKRISPCIGDIVLLSYRTNISVTSAKIVEIVERCSKT